MSAAIDAGADMINDVRALQNDGCLAAIANSNVPVCLMHMQGIPKNMQNSPSYDHVINDIRVFFQQRIDTCISAGIARERLILDPGFGFGKTLEQNFYLLANLSKPRG
jgi:dihydropteroate synthase